ncbi:MAG: HAMP domain-containing protein [Chloroflexi bacterium]|jgi:signal transduction histidine kinase|nr:HAMP domain-containing protein [Chloroflexota bacterium]
MFSSIRLRLSLSHLAVIILAMGLSAFLLLTFLENYFLDAAKNSLEAQARITAQALIPGSIPDEFQPESEDWAPAHNAIQQQQISNIAISAENLPSLPVDTFLNETDLTYLTDASLQLSTQLETRIRILNTQGIVLIDSQQEEQGSNLSTDSLVSEALTGKTSSRTDTRGEDTMHLALPAISEGQLMGVVYLSQTLGDITAVLHDLRTRLLLSTGIALLVSAIVALLLSRAISNPIHRLTNAATAVAHGDFDQQVPVRSRDELGQLSRTFNDMTARLRAARQMQANFVADVSHESRTPLTSIKGMVETLRDGAVDDPEVRDRFLSTIKTETDRLIHMVNDLLLLSQADSAALNLSQESIDISELVQTVVDQLLSQPDERKLELKTQIHPGTPLVWIDPDRIQQVLINLLDNAIKYSHDGGSVTIEAIPQKDQKVLIKIRDEGIGIPTEDLPHIGQRFYRTDKARSRAKGGAGLGLAIAKSFIEAHGGQLWVDSEEGQGTTVSFTLPL